MVDPKKTVDILASQYLFDLPVYTRNTESTVTCKLNDRPNIMLQNETWNRRRLRLVLDCSQPVYLRWELEFASEPSKRYRSQTPTK